MSDFRRHEKAGSASLFVGDPRAKNNDIDAWWNGLLAESSEPRSRPYLYGSDAGLCARRNVLHEHNTWIPNDKPATANAYMSIGVALENMLAKGLFDSDRLLVQNMRLIDMPELKISGKIDLIAFDHEDELALFEIKSCGKLPADPNPVHLAQIQTYAAVSGIHRCWLTYISRNVREEFGSAIAIRTFRVDTSREILQARLTTAALSVNASRLHKLPPVPATFRKHTECHYCEYRDHFCWFTRPGLGGDAPSSPLPELEPKEMGGLLLSASNLASKLMDETLLRKVQTLAALEELPFILESQRDRVAILRMAAMQLIAS
jgi:hypothetical protein